MKLKTVRVRMFRNVLDSTEVQIQPDITCVVGKNESGKTAFLQALWRLNPARTNPEFSAASHYPAWLEKRHRLDGTDVDKVNPIEANFLWQDKDVEAIEAKFGVGVVKPGTDLVLWKNYDNKFVWKSGLNEKKAVDNFLAAQSMDKSVAALLSKVDTFEKLAARISEEMDKPEVDEAISSGLNAVQSALGLLFKKGETFSSVSWSIALSRIPQFLYFAEYSKLPYTVKINDVLKGTNLDDSEATARALLRLGGAEDDYILNPDYELRKRELENVANVLTEDVNKYWSQNPDLRVQPDVTQRTESRNDGRHSVLDEMKLRIWDGRHSLSLPFNEHSAGFQWFFSFLAAFSEYEFKDPPVVILLDEPAVGLHAKAQADFLRFIEERLAKRCQVIYTTHSPFMVQPGRLDRVRLVEDLGKDEGSVVSAEVLTRDRDTLFPLQSALGYDLVQHLFVAENNLVVEGTSDYAFLKLLSDFLISSGRIGLDAKWSVVPVGGADVIPTFVALLGNHLKITVLVDSRKEGHQRLDRMAKDGFLKKNRILLVGELLQRKTADIEDLFEIGEYLDLYNKAFGKKLAEKDLKGDDPIVSRIARYEGVDRYDHGRPADVLLREREAVMKALSSATLDRFENLFKQINATLE